MSSRRALNSEARRTARRVAFGLSALIAVVGAVGCATPPVKLPEAIASDSLRHPPAGSLVGTRGSYGGLAWYGIPYARPPIGDRRFRAPEALPRWAGTRQATEFGSSCPQYASSTNSGDSVPVGDLVGSEDCLFLNVYAPEESEARSAGSGQGGKGLPVMVWIHGGGNTSGTSSFYNGARLANEKQVVVVTINYRLGFLGWFRHRALREDAAPIDASGNFGTLDQILALDWVQKNISAFGGDEKNVTIFGESAGGWNVMALMASPLAAGQFHRAISQSGLTWSYSPDRAENYVDDERPGEASSSGETLVRLLIAAGRARDRAEAKRLVESMGASETSRFLRERSVAELFQAYVLEGSEAEDGYVCPRIFEDGVVLPSTPLGHAFRAGSSFNRVPVLLGTNRDEEKLFLLYNDEYISQVFGAIPTMRDRGRYLRDAATISRIWRMMAVDEVAEDLSRAMPGSVFSYRFDWDEQPQFLWSDLGEMIGAAHGFEIPFVFGHWDLGPDSHRLFDESNRAGRESLSDMMMSYWAEFAARGRPGRGDAQGLPEWPAWTPGAPKFAILDTPEGGGLRFAVGRDSAEEIVETILADTSYKNLRRRCSAIASIHNWAPLAFSTEDFQSVGDGLCREFMISELVGAL